MEESKEMASSLAGHGLDLLGQVTPNPFNVIFLSINKVLNFRNTLAENLELHGDMVHRVANLSLVIQRIMYMETTAYTEGGGGGALPNIS